jgi:cell division protease FtsH
MGGRCAEHIIMGELSFGAASDLNHATMLARHMIEIEGMGTITPGAWDRKIASEALLIELDRGARELLDEAEARARKIIEEHREELLALVTLLLKEEVLDQHTLPAFTKPLLPKPPPKALPQL